MAVIIPLVIGIVAVMTVVVTCIAYVRIRAQGPELPYSLDGVVPEVAEGIPRQSKNRTPAQAMRELRAQMFRERARVPNPSPLAAAAVAGRRYRPDRRGHGAVTSPRTRDGENSTGTLPEGYLSSENSAATSMKVNENSRASASAEPPASNEGSYPRVSSRNSGWEQFAADGSQVHGFDSGSNSSASSSHDVDDSSSVPLHRSSVGSSAASTATGVGPRVAGAALAVRAGGYGTIVSHYRDV